MTMIGAGRILRAPWDVTRRVLQALDDLAALADRARRDPDPVQEARERLDALLVEARAILALGGELSSQASHVTDAHDRCSAWFPRRCRASRR